MTVMHKIEAWLVGQPGRRYCDDCISKLLSVKPRQQVQQKTSRLAEKRELDRRISHCSQCKRDDKLAIGVIYKPSELAV